MEYVRESKHSMKCQGKSHFTKMVINKGPLFAKFDGEKIQLLGTK